jgi:hypothetical protein
MNAHPEQPPLFIEGNRPCSPKPEADELRVAILEHVGRALQRTVEPEVRCAPGALSNSGPSLASRRSPPTLILPLLPVVDGGALVTRPSRQPAEEKGRTRAEVSPLWNARARSYT